MPSPNFNVLYSNTITPWSNESIGGALSVLGNQGLGGPASTSNPTGSFCIYVPFYSVAPFPVKGVFWHNGATVAGNVDVGIYSADRRRLFSCGPQLQSGTNVLQFTQIPTYELGTGLFFMGICLSNVTGTMFAASFIAGNSGTGLQYMAGVYQQGSNTSLPTTGTFSAPFADYIPIFGITAQGIL